MGTILGNASITLTLDTAKAREDLQRFEAEAKRVGQASRTSTETFSTSAAPVLKTPPSPFRVSIKREGIASVGTSGTTASPVLPKAAQRMIGQSVGAGQQVDKTGRDPASLARLQRKLHAIHQRTVNPMETAANAMRSATGSGGTIFGRAASIVEAKLPTAAPVAKALGGAALIYAGARTLAKSADVGMAAAAGIPDIADSPAFGALRQQVQDIAFGFTKFENAIKSIGKSLVSVKDRSIAGARLTGQIPALALDAEMRLNTDEANMESAFDRFKRNEWMQAAGKHVFETVRRGFAR